MDASGGDQPLVVQVSFVRDSVSFDDDGGPVVIRFEDDGGPVMIRFTEALAGDSGWLTEVIEEARTSEDTLTLAATPTDMPQLLEMLDRQEVTVVGPDDEA